SMSLSVINAASPNSPTMDDGTYNPYAIDAPLTLYASGIRNAYDLVWHTNGQLYVPTNGTAGGSRSPASVAGTRRPDGSFYSGPIIPSIGPNEVQRDWLFRIDPNRSIAYYGHPNPLRGEYVLNRGSIDAGRYPANTSPDTNYAGAAFDFAFNVSPNGVIEYRSSAHGGQLQGALLVCRYSGGSDIIALMPNRSNGDIADSRIGIPGLTGFNDPLDIVEDVSTGNLYVSDFATSEIILLRPSPAP
ncbi:MAG: glycosyl hydrolase, partial [Myxococcota bacterium]